MRLRDLQSAARQICDAFGIPTKFYPSVRFSDLYKDEFGTIFMGGDVPADILINKKLCCKDKVSEARVLVHEICHVWIGLQGIKLTEDAEETICNLVESLLSDYIYEL